MIKLPDVRDPIIFAMLVVLAIALVSMGVAFWQKRGLEVELAESRQELAETVADRDALKGQRDAALTNNAALARAVQEQSERVRALRTEATAREVRAGTAARTILVDRIIIPEGRGPEALNRWLQGSFSASQ